MVRSIHGFAEKVVLIINGGGGVGRAVAIQLALEGAFVIIGFSGKSDENKLIIEQLKSLGTLAHAVQFNSAQQLVEEVDKIYGRIDLIVGCVNSDESLSLSLLNEVIDESIRLTRSRPKISIVFCGTDEKIIESTKKLSQNLPKNHRINCIITKLQSPKKEFELFSENTFDDTARVITFLLSSEAKALNGQVLYID